MRSKYFFAPLHALVFCVTLTLGVSQGAVAKEFSLDMRGVNIEEFINTIGKFTKKTIIIDDRVKGKVDIQSHKLLSEQELYDIFLTQLSVNGYAVVNVGNDILKVIPNQIAKLEGIDVQSGAAPNSQSESIITRIVQVSDVNVDKLVATLRPLVDSKSGVIAAYTDSNVILITDRESNVRRIEKIIREVDYVDSQSLELIKLKHASAGEVEKMLSKLLDKQNQEAPGIRPVISSDERTNTLILRADNSTKAYLRKVIASLDEEVISDGNTRVLYLRFANASDIEKVLKGVSNAMIKEEKGSSGKALSQAKYSNIHIEAHDQTNALVLSGSPNMINNLEKIVKKLDIRRAQVLVEAIIVEITDDKAKELGVQWLFRDGGGSAAPLGAINFANNSPSIINIADNIISSNDSALSVLSSTSGALFGVGKSSTNGFSFAALLNALATDSESNVLSTPSLLTMDNQEASILVGREVPVLTGSTVSSNNSNPFQTIDRMDIGVKLKVKPQINDGGTVQLSIEQEVSSLTGLTASDIITNKRVINTTVLVDDKATIVLGGLMDEDIQESSSKVPLLGDIPVVGRAFSSEGTKKVKRNLMVFIRPTIMSDEKSIAEASHQKYRYMREKQIAKQSNGINLMPDEKVEVLPVLQADEIASSEAEPGWSFPSD